MSFEVVPKAAGALSTVGALLRTSDFDFSYVSGPPIVRGG